MRSRARPSRFCILFHSPLPQAGWEIISDKMTWRITDPNMLVDEEVPGYVRRVSEDSTDLASLHNKFAKRTTAACSAMIWPGMSTGAGMWTTPRWPSTIPPMTGLWYLVYLIDEDIMYVKEMVCLNTEAKKGLFRYIIAHESMWMKCGPTTTPASPLPLPSGTVTSRKQSGPTLWGA